MYVSKTPGNGVPQMSAVWRDVSREESSQEVQRDGHSAAPQKRHAGPIH